jgi:hypothetical protein
MAIFEIGVVKSGVLSGLPAGSLIDFGKHGKCIAVREHGDNANGLLNLTRNAWLEFPPQLHQEQFCVSFGKVTWGVELTGDLQSERDTNT